MYLEIINEIKSNLGSNNELNRQYLSSQIDVYKDHPYNKKIIKEISRLMWDCLNEDEKREFIEISEKENPIMDIMILKTENMKLPSKSLMNSWRLFPECLRMTR